MMFPLRDPKRRTVDHCGARAGAVLCGSARNNQGLRLQVLEDQPRGNSGPLKGLFVILDVGDNRHSPVLRDLLNHPTDAAQVLRLLREGAAGCVSVANANILVLGEADDPPQAPLARSSEVR